MNKPALALALLATLGAFLATGATAFQSGRLTVSVFPDNARVKLYAPNGRLVATAAGPDATFAGLAAGEYRAIASAAGYRSESQRVRVTASARVGFYLNRIANRPQARTAPGATPAKPAYRGANVTCTSFASWSEAQLYYRAYGGRQLDRDGSGVACEYLR